MSNVTRERMRADFGRWIVMGVVWLALSPFSRGAAATPADARLADFFQGYLDARFQQQPAEATRLGDHRFDVRLEDVSPAARRGWVELARKTLAALPQQVDYKALTRDGQIDYEVFEHDLQAQLWLAENTKPFEEDPRTYGTYITDSVYALLTQSTLPKETNISNVISRMAAIPAVIATAKATLTHPPKTILETSIRQNRGAIAFYEEELFQLAGETPQLAKVKAAAAPIVAALKDYQAFLEGDLLARATGEWRLGKRVSARNWTTNSFPARRPIRCWRMRRRNSRACSATWG